jgi:hypothetical protein
MANLEKSKVEALVNMLRDRGVDKGDLAEVERLLTKNVGSGVAQDDENVAPAALSDAEELGMDGRFHAKPAHRNDRRRFDEQHGIPSRRVRVLG